MWEHTQTTDLLHITGGRHNVSISACHPTDWRWCGFHPVRELCVPDCERPSQEQRAFSEAYRVLHGQCTYTQALHHPQHMPQDEGERVVQRAVLTMAEPYRAVIQEHQATAEVLGNQHKVWHLCLTWSVHQLTSIGRNWYERWQASYSRHQSQRWRVCGYTRWSVGCKHWSTDTWDGEVV